MERKSRKGRGRSSAPTSLSADATTRQEPDPSEALSLATLERPRGDLAGVIAGANTSPMAEVNKRQSSEINEYYTEDLTCPICLDVRRDCKILQCANGHLLCEPCYKGVAQCPLCRAALPKPGFRNLFAEKAIRNLVQSCMNKQRGCMFATNKAKDYDTHMESCLFKPVECPVCLGGQNHGELLDHLTKEHGAEYLTAGADGFLRAVRNYNDAILRPMVLSFDYCLFIVTFAAQRCRIVDRYALLAYHYSQAGSSEEKLFIGLEGQRAIFSAVIEPLILQDISDGTAADVDRTNGFSVMDTQLRQILNPDNSFVVAFKERI